ncbi:MAG: hypothetical protein E7440_05590 [Ruminococcaceae bacterium]|nr:hypothetical protein [Oscillospiraceae bacterium]
MKDKKKRLWWADRLKFLCLALMLIFAMIGHTGSVVGLIGVFVVLPVFLAVELLMNCCPHCDRYLGRDRGRFCQHCGERIREDKTET